MKKDDWKISPFIDCYTEIKSDLRQMAPEFLLWFFLIFGTALTIGIFIQ